MHDDVIDSRWPVTSMPTSPTTGGTPGSSGSTCAARISKAVELIAALRGLDLDDARRDLRAAAKRTGSTDAEVARTVIVFHGAPLESAGNQHK